MCKKIFLFAFSKNINFDDTYLLFNNYDEAFNYVKYCSRLYRYDNQDTGLVYGNMGFVIPFGENAAVDDLSQTFNIICTKCDENITCLAVDNVGDSNCGYWNDFAYKPFSNIDAALDVAIKYINDAIDKYNRYYYNVATKEYAIDNLKSYGRTNICYDGRGIDHRVELVTLETKKY